MERVHSAFLHEGTPFKLTVLESKVHGEDNQGAEAVQIVIHVVWVLHISHTSQELSRNFIRVHPPPQNIESTTTSSSGCLSVKVFSTKHQKGIEPAFSLLNRKVNIHF